AQLASEEEILQRAEAVVVRAEAAAAAADDAIVHVPGVGSMRRRQLRNLESVLSGSDFTAEGPDDLPDLSSLSASQLASLEAAISSGHMQSLSASPSRRASREPGPALPQATVQPPQFQRAAPPPIQDAGFAATSPPLREQPPQLDSERDPQQSVGETRPAEGAWRVHEAALAGLAAQGLHKGSLECSICCDALDS
ncbi:unnamed protein product, partial [Polarella glacialis]